MGFLIVRVLYILYVLQVPGSTILVYYLYTRIPGILVYTVYTCNTVPGTMVRNCTVILIYNWYIIRTYCTNTVRTMYSYILIYNTVDTQAVIGMIVKSYRLAMIAILYF